MAHLGLRNGTSKTFYDRVIVYSYKVDPVKAFPDIFQQMRHTNGLPPPSFTSRMPNPPPRRRASAASM